MHYRERAKIVKSIEIKIPRKEAIVAIKKEFGLGLAESREFYEKLIDGTFIGQNYSEHTYNFMWLDTTDWCNVETEDAPLSKEEQEEETLRVEAEAWEKTLTDKERKYMKILNPVVVAVAG